MSRSCIFCGKTNLTKEHILPKWLQNYFGTHTTGGLHVVTKADGSSYQFNEKFFNRTAKIVCEECNSGWMSNLEGTIEKLLGPMVAGEGSMIGIGRYERSLLAHWVAKTMTILEYAGNARTNNIPKSVPETLYKSRTLLPEHTIYMGFRRDAYGVRGVHPAGFLVQSPTNLTVKPEHQNLFQEFQGKNNKIFSAALVIGHVYFYMVGTDIDNAFSFVYPYIPDYLLQLWPEETAKDILWPNTKPIEDKGGWDGMNSHLNQSIALDFHKIE